MNSQNTDLVPLGIGVTPGMSNVNKLNSHTTLQQMGISNLNRIGMADNTNRYEKPATI